MRNNSLVKHVQSFDHGNAIASNEDSYISSKVSAKAPFQKTYPAMMKSVFNATVTRGKSRDPQNTLYNT